MAEITEQPWQPAKSDKSERLLQLTCALLYAERGLTKAELFRAIPAYIEAIKAGTAEDALHRMFERDKTDLRDTGIQIYIKNPNAEAEEMCYMIADDTFIWPQPFELSAKQLQLLTLASQVWSQASLQSDASQALVRLRALGVEQAASDLTGFAPRIQTHEPSFLTLASAIENRFEIGFSYRKASGEVSKRRVQPWSLQNVDGQWLLQSFDLDRKEVRNFLLKRIISKVSVTKDGEVERKFDAPAETDVKNANQSLKKHVSEQICELHVKKDSHAWFHFHLDDEPASDGIIRFNYMDLGLLAEELRDFIGEIKVVRPQKLVEIISQGFAKVATDHA